MAGITAGGHSAFPVPGPKARPRRYAPRQRPRTERAARRGGTGVGAEMSGGFEDVELADAVQAVREGLTSAAARGAGQDLAFEVGEIAMEFTVEIRKDLKGSGGVKAWVVSADAEASRGSTRTHKVAFTLT